MKKLFFVALVFLLGCGDGMGIREVNVTDIERVNTEKISVAEGTLQFGRSELLSPGQIETLAEVAFADKGSRLIGIVLSAELPVTETGAPAFLANSLAAIIEWGTSGSQHRTIVDVTEGVQISVKGSYCRVSMLNELDANPTSNTPPLPAGGAITGRATLSFDSSIGGARPATRTLKVDPLAAGNPGLIDTPIAAAGSLAIPYQEEANRTSTTGLQHRIPPFARSIQVLGNDGTDAPAFTIFFLASGAGAPIATQTFAGGVTMVDPLSIPNGTTSILITNDDANDARFTPIFFLDL